MPYLAVNPVEFQTLDQWGASQRGLLPVEATMMVAIPELDGATGSMVFGGRGSGAEVQCTGCSHGCRFDTSQGAHDMRSCIERADMLAARVGKLIDLRRSERAQRKVGMVLFNFPPNAGNTGTAAFLAVFESLHNTLLALKREGYTVEVPATVDELRIRVIEGNAAKFGAQANVHTRIPADDHVKRERHLREIESQWGAAPGPPAERRRIDLRARRALRQRLRRHPAGLRLRGRSDAAAVRERLRAHACLLGLLPLAARGLRAPTRCCTSAPTARWSSCPASRTGLTATCWPDRLIGDLPNLYLYASNNPREGTIAKRRAAATLISYLTPPVAQAGLYKGLMDLKAALERFRSLEPEAQAERAELADDDPGAGRRTRTGRRRAGLGRRQPTHASSSSPRRCSSSSTR